MTADIREGIAGIAATVVKVELLMNMTIARLSK